MPTTWIFYNYNVPEHDYGDGRGDREAETDEEVVRQSCQRVERLDLKLLGRPAVGCRTQNGEEITVRIGALYEAEHMVGHSPLQAQLIVGLTTSRSRLGADWPVFVALAEGVARCTPHWEMAAWQSVRNTTAGASPPTAPLCPLALW